MDYRDELRLCLQQALLQERDSLPQPGTVTPIFRDKTRRPGPMAEMGTGVRRYEELGDLAGTRAASASACSRCVRASIGPVVARPSTRSARGLPGWFLL